MLDNSQGGFIDDKYQSIGKQSPVLPDGRVLYEGEFTRDLVNRIAVMCQDQGIPYRKLVPEERDIHAEERVRRANQFNKLHHPCIVLSVRLNKTQREAHHKFRNIYGISAYYKAPQINGFRLWNKNGDSSPEKMAARILLQFMHIHSGFNKRGIKKCSQKIFAGLQIPLLMTRSGFIDHQESCEMLLNPEVRDSLAKAHFDAIRCIHKVGLSKDLNRINSGQIGQGWFPLESNQS